MEYLMTYGWAILIIAVVLGALFQLGVFNAGTFAPRAPPGACQVFRPNGPMTSSLINLEGVCSGELPQYASIFSGANSVFISGSQPGSQGAFTVSFWFDPTSLGAGTGWAGNMITSIGNNDNPNTYTVQFLYQSSQTVYINGPCPGSIGASASTPLNTWSMLTFVDTGSSGSVYVNAANPNGNYYCTSLGNKFNIAYPVGPYITGGAFAGGVSNLQIYNTSLSANEIQYLYDEGIGGSPINLQSLVGWWPLNGNANDYSGNNNNGAPSGVTYTNQWSGGYTPP